MKLSRLKIFILCLFILRAVSSNAGYTKFESDYHEFEASFVEYTQYLDRSLKARKKSKIFYEQVKNKVLSSEELRRIHNMTLEYKKIRDYFWAYIDEYEWLGDKYLEFEITKGETKIKTKRKRIRRPGTHKHRFKNVRYKKVYLNPTDDLGIIKILQLKLALNTALVLYDNYLHAIRPYVLNTKLRRIINQDNIELSGFLNDVADDFDEVSSAYRVERVINYYDKVLDWEKSHANEFISRDGYNVFINDLIQRSHSYHNLKDFNLAEIFKEKIKYSWNYIRDKLFKIQIETMNELSKGFGNSVGLIQTRSGKLSHLGEDELTRIEKKMQPLDIIFEKTPFRLTDKFIPGHWGHVAIWVGNEKQLKEIGLWDELGALDQYIREVNGYKGESLQDKIRSGYMVLEALRAGVQINTLEHFMDVDDLATIRLKKELSLEQKRDYLRKAFKQIGKEYDFNFDVETDKKIVCSELAYVVFEDLDWPVEQSVGRYTISPDNVAVKAAKGGEFEPILIYHDGKEVTQQLDENFLRLLNLQYNNIQF